MNHTSNKLVRDVNYYVISCVIFSSLNKLNWFKALIYISKRGYCDFTQFSLFF